MLFFLDFARRAGLVVEGYEDVAEGVMAKRADGRMAMILVTLQPRIEWGGEAPNAEGLAGLHHRAHGACFIANSVTCEVKIDF